MQLLGGTLSEMDNEAPCPFYGVEWNKMPVCLELRFPDGSRKAIPYSYFTEMGFDTELGIEIHTTAKRILISGRNLLSLFELLVTYRVRFVQADIGQDTQEDGLFVERIEIEAADIISR